MTRAEIIRDLHRIREEHWAETRHLSARERAARTNQEVRKLIKKWGLKVRMPGKVVRAV